jgi:hypothetical protein
MPTGFAQQHFNKAQIRKYGESFFRVVPVRRCNAGQDARDAGNGTPLLHKLFH